LVPFAVAAVLARAFRRDALGPTEAERATRETPGEVVRGLVAGARHVAAIPQVANGLGAIAMQRLCLGIWTVLTVLLYRNHFAADGVFRVGLGGLGQVVAALAIGGALAALVTPTAFRRIGAAIWPGAMLLVSAAADLVFDLPYSLPLWVASALVLSFASQGVKISVDTLIQRHVIDAFRGRVFAIYDMVFNIALVIAAVLTAAALPEDGHSPAAMVGIAAGWAGTALVYLTRSRRTTRAVR
jgi:MFS family permease